MSESHGPSPSAWAVPLPRHRRDALRTLLPAVLLAVIAAAGVRNHIVRDQSSWQGASFGMFATFENDTSRSVAVTIDDDEGRRRVAVPDDLADDVRRLEVVPSDAVATQLASDVADRLESPATVEVVVRGVVLSGDDPLVLRYERLAKGSAER